MNYQSVVVDEELVAVIRGAFDGSVAPVVHADLVAAFDSGVKRVVIDLCECEHVDEGALAVLAAAAVTALNSGGRLYLAMDPDLIVEVLDASLVRAVFER
jgi:anti-anti-sigma factor